MVLFACGSQCLDTTTLRHLRRVTEAMRAMPGRVTMRGLARWAGTGGSDRTIQRFFITSISWATLQWALLRPHRLDPDDVILLGGDDVVVTKAGQHTHGWDRFFSSLYGKMVRGRGFLSVSLMSVKRRTSYPVMLEHLAPPHLATPQEGSKKKSQGKRGRPKGSKNQPRRDVPLSPYRRVVQETTKRLLQLLGAQGQVMSVVFDGALGHNDARQMVRQLGGHLIATLRDDAALSFPCDGPYAGRGKRKKYGKKLDDRHSPEAYWKESSVDEAIETKSDQVNVWQKKCADVLHIVVTVKTNLTTQAVAHVVFFSSDLTLSSDQVIDYYRLRFQLEFNFRDAKQ